MDGFKSNPKMKSDIACYKEGGSVYSSRSKEKAEEKKDIVKDKKMIKKAVGQHESAKHKGEEKTEIKLKNGGRSKKECGTARKYKAGGVCNPMKDGGAIEMKKGKDDKKAIAQTKKTKAGKANTPSAATGKKKESPKTVNKPAKKTMTASMVGTLPAAPEAPSAAMDMPMDQPIEMADGSQVPGQRYSYGEVNGMPVNEQQMLAAQARMQASGNEFDAQNPDLAAFANQARARMPQRRRPMPGNAGLGPIGQQALATDPTAAPMGAQQAAGGIQPMSAPMTPTQDIMRGLQAIGQYAGGGSAC